MSVIKKLNSEAIVAFHVAYAKLPGSDPMCALFLSQVSYWCARSEDGVAWITHQAMYSQTGMSRKQQDRAAAYWSAQGVMDKFIKGIPPKIHYFVYFDRLERLILDAELQQNDMSERDNLVVRNGQQVLSERGKTSREDSKEILSCVGSSQQQSESASGISITTLSQALAQTLDQPLSSRATPHSPLPPSPRKRFVPPTEDEWLAYCRLTFPTWKNSAAQSVHAYYVGVGWKGKVDWKACAKTCFHRAKPWDLQPAQAAAQKPRETPAERRAREDREGREWFAAQGGVMPE